MSSFLFNSISITLHLIHLKFNYNDTTENITVSSAQNFPDGIDVTNGNGFRGWCGYQNEDRMNKTK